MKQRDPPGTVPVDSVGMLAEFGGGLEKGDGCAGVATLDGIEQLPWWWNVGSVRRGRGRGSARPLFLDFTDDGDDLLISALGGDCERRRRNSMRINPDARVGAVFHQHAHHL